MRAVLIAVPWLLLSSTYLVYQLSRYLLGVELGYFIGFLFYWIVWCLGFSWWVLGKEQLVDVFRGTRDSLTSRRWFGVALLLVPLLMAYGYEFPRALPQANLPVLIVSVVISIVNGTGEELLWRGVYPRVFPQSRWWGYLYPTIGFAVWHLAPQSVFPNTRPGGMISLVVAAGIVGLMWGWLAFRTKSIRWTTLSHILFDFSGLGGRVYF